MNSPLIQAEMQGWEIDSIISIGMAAAFFLPTVLPFPWIQALVPYLDSILTIILSMIMLPMPIKTVISGIRDLLLISPERNHSRDPRVGGTGVERVSLFRSLL